MSQHDSKKETIDGQTYEVYMLSPKRARAMLVEMLRIVGPALATAAQNGGGQDLTKLDLRVVAQDLFASLTPELLDQHMSSLAEVTQVDGKTLDKIFEIHFRGRLGTMFKWYFFAVRTNFEDFFGALGGASSLLPRPAKPASP